MKFKVGDKVKLVKMEDESEYYREYLGKTYTIKRIESSQGGNYAIFEEKTEKSVIPYLKNLELIKEYTHEDLKKSPIGTKITFENGEVLVKDDDGNYSNKKRWRDDSDLKELKDRVNTLGKIIKIEEPTYQTVYESKVEILDEVEKRYLRGVIRPFKDKVKYIEKCKSVTYEDDSYICVQIKNASSITLPYFESKTMYKNMEDDKKYTLEELGL